MHRRSVHYALIAAIASLIFFSNLGVAPLWDRDEPRNAGCAAEMLAAGDWVVPVFNAELRTHKPVLLYWLMMGSYSVFGITEFGARFASALCGLATVGMTYGIGRRLFDHTTGVWASVVLGTTIMFGVASRAATPDGLLIFCSTLALTLFVFAAFPGNDANKLTDGLFPKKLLPVVGVYAAMGLGVLAKGPVGALLPTAVIGMYLLIVLLKSQPSEPGLAGLLKNAARTFGPKHFVSVCWTMRPLTAIVSIAAIAAPWYIWVSARTDGVWTHEFFFTHNVSRAAQTMEGHSGPPILFYVATILVGCFPWSILAIPTGIHTKALAHLNLRTQRAVTFLLCWIGVYVVLFSISQTKLPSYVTPCYPALAILLGAFVRSLMSREEEETEMVSLGTSSVRQAMRLRLDGQAANTGWWLKIGVAHLVVVGILIGIALPLAARWFLPGAEWLGVLGLIPLVGGLFCWRTVQQERVQHLPVQLGLTAVAFSFFLMAIVPAVIGRQQEYDELYQRTAGHSGPIASFGYLEPSWIFYGQRPIRDFEVTEANEFADFLQQNPDVAVITTAARMQEAFGTEEHSESGLLNYRVLHQTEYFLRDRELLLIQPTSKATEELAKRRSESQLSY